MLTIQIKIRRRSVSEILKKAYGMVTPKKLFFSKDIANRYMKILYMSTSVLILNPTFYS